MPRIFQILWIAYRIIIIYNIILLTIFYQHSRAIDFNALVGTIGGYIGLFLGFSLLQIPGLILLITRNAKKYFTKLGSTKNNVVKVNTKMDIRDDGLNYV